MNVKKDKRYVVTGMVKKGHHPSYAIGVWAPNAKAAKELALSLWTKDAHLFWLRADVAGMDIKLRDGYWTKTGEVVDHHWVDYV